MRLFSAVLAICLSLGIGVTYAHHPAEDIVDEEIYAMIDEMVADTPHATLVFDDDMGTTTITTDSVSAAEDLVDDGLLATLSLLDEEVTVVITFMDEVEEIAETALESDGAKRQGDTWEERNDWGRRVVFEVNRILRPNQ